MGRILNAKFDSTCKKCGLTWSEGEKIYYQKDPKALCKELKCFIGQGGFVETKPEVVQKRTIEERMAETTKAIQFAIEKYEVVALKFDGKLEPKDGIVFIESIVKTLVGSR